jgi:hypothetical protein
MIDFGYTKTGWGGWLALSSMDLYNKHRVRFIIFYLIIS